MCYSAQLVQRAKELFRRSGIRLDYEETLRLLLQRRDDPGITISRAFEENFDVPTNEDERQIKDLIDEHRARIVTQCESELFKQKTRLVTAERKLKEKLTKAAQNDVRIAGNKIDALGERLASLRRTHLVADDARIYPMQFAGVVIKQDDSYLLTPMRYHCRPIGKAAFLDRKFPGLYNARRDSLGQFWRDLFGRYHAVAVVDCFFENVKEHDLAHRELAHGEKEKNIVLQFTPTPARHMFVPCLWSPWTGANEADLRSFAIITDDPPVEVAAAGHNRCPVNLKATNVDSWLTPAGRSVAELDVLLADRETPFYQHEVLAA